MTQKLSDIMDWKEIKNLIKEELKGESKPSLREASITAKDTKFNK